MFQLQHLDAGVDAGHDGAPVAQRREQGAGAAPDVEDPPPGHIPGQVQDRGPRVIAVEEVGLSLCPFTGSERDTPARRWLNF